MTLDFITPALLAANVQADVLNSTDRDALAARISRRLSVDIGIPALWDRPSASVGRQRDDGWEQIPAYVGNTTCLMFLDGARTIWRFRGGADLLRVLKECPPLEFYVCDEEASYLLCSNHHDFVIGWGAASAWVEALGDG
ncbi:MAG: hypothetical protein J0H86_19065 [Xanthomonadaceae bacterium]|mgnify:CR=1 FL=1|nr:hypothetical protein [Xanthomonadaceae bacterium]